MRIPILHLTDGTHSFDFLVKGGELHFYRAEIYPNDISVHLEVNKLEKNIKCSLSVETSAHYTCDRCLTEFERPYAEKFELLFHIGRQDMLMDQEDVIVLPSGTVDIDLTDRLIEYLILTIPMKVLCKDTCRGLCPTCGVDLNKEKCTCSEVSPDPRWEKLRQLLGS